MGEQHNALIWQKDAFFSGTFSGVVSANKSVKNTSSITSLFSRCHPDGLL
jgi:hypothetical protein